MPIFYFVVHGTSSIPDPEGWETPDLNTAMEEAREAAREIWADGIRAGHNRRAWSIDVTDDQGTVLGSAAFEEMVRPSGTDPARRARREENSRLH